MVFTYNFFVRLYAFVTVVLSPFNKKAKKWIYGRVNWGKNIPEKTSQKRLWLHCASLGEFEQARPIVEKLIASNKCELAVSFFSPSGYEVRKNYPLAKAVFYLPVDTKENAKTFILKLKPDVIVFVKYDLWFHFINEAKQQFIPMYLISAVFRNNQIFFKPWGDIFRNMLNNLDGIFVQDEESISELKTINLKAEVAGDVRYDRALEVLTEDFEDKFIEEFVGQKFTIIFGSTYNIEHHWIKHLADELKLLNIDFRIILAPHQIDADNMVDVKDHFPNAYYYSRSNLKPINNLKSKILVLDTMGMLTYVYRFANLAYVGGGFETSLHNSLEAAVYGIPVVVGPNHFKFPEVEKLISLGGFIQVNSKIEFVDFFKKMIINQISGNEKGDINAAFVRENAGASKLVLKTLEKHF